MKYNVSVPFYCSVLVEVEADSPEEALEVAANEAHASLCHQCARQVEMGEFADEHLTIDCVSEA